MPNNYFNTYSKTSVNKYTLTEALSSWCPSAEECSCAASIFDLSSDTWWLNGTLGSNWGVGLIPNARLCASSEATVFFLGFDTPRPRFRGRSLWWEWCWWWPGLSLSSGRWGEESAAAANSCASEEFAEPGREFWGTLRGFGPGFRRAGMKNWTVKLRDSLWCNVGSDKKIINVSIIEHHFSENIVIAIFIYRLCYLTRIRIYLFIVKKKNSLSI